MAQTHRKCLFCGASGSSKEDVVPKWIGRLLCEGAPDGMHYVFHHRSAHPDVGVPDQAKTANLPAVYTRAFCEKCNNGWMSELETQVKPVLKPLILGVVFYLSIGYTGRPGLRLLHDAGRVLKEIWPSARDELHWPPPLILPEHTPHQLISLVVRDGVIQNK